MCTAALPRPLSRRAALCLTVAGAVLGSAAGAPRAQPLPPLAPSLAFGTFGPWTGAAEGDAYVLGNADAPGAMHRVLAAFDPAAEGRRTLTVEVEIRRGGAGSRAGLVYGYRAQPETYLLFVLEGRGGVSLYRRGPDGMERPVSVVSGQIRPGPNRLAIREHGGLIDLLVNGRQVGAFGAPGVGYGAAGIVAWGTGVFAFRDFTQTTE